MNLRILLLLLFLSTANLSIAQHTPYALGIKFHKGFIVAHRNSMGHLIKGHPHIAELTFGKTPTGNDKWHHNYNFPEMGLLAMYINHANPEQLGNAYTLMPYINFNLNKSKKIKLQFRAATGIAYLPTVFHPVYNHKNLAISSRLNGAVNLNFQTRVKLSEKIWWDNGISLTHYSNGAYSLPNLGINLATLNTGFTIPVGNPLPAVPLQTEKKRHDNKLIISLMGVAGIKAFEPFGKKYYIYTIRGLAEKSVSEKSAIGTGLDFVWNSSLPDKINKDTILINTTSDVIQSGLVFSYAFTIDKLSLFVNKGLYLQSNDVMGLFYHRLGVKYRFKNHIIASFAIKSHFGYADHFEYGIGYSF
jgi:hypothetical protein